MRLFNVYQVVFLTYCTGYIACFHISLRSITSRQNSRPITNEASGTESEDDTLAPTLAGNTTSDTRSASHSFDVAKGSPILHSSIGNISSAETSAGLTLYSVPINATVYKSVLEETMSELSDLHGETNLYTSNFSSWSFEVAVVHGTLDYAVIYNIARRFLALVPPSPGDLVHTRVATVKRNGQNVADVALFPTDTLPLFNASSHNATADIDPATGEVLVETSLPIGTTDQRSPYNSADIDRFIGHMPTVELKKRADHPVDYVYRGAIVNTAYQLTIRAFISEDGALRQALVQDFRGAVRSALTRLGMIVASYPLRQGQPSENVAIPGLSWVDSGVFMHGAAYTFLQMYITLRLANGELATLEVDDWSSIINCLLEPLSAFPANHMLIAMEGYIYGPHPETGITVALGIWNLGTGNTHDEL
ncbi:MAG: hypothetical protein Q9190_002577 [Brigantiaea leucoxantha]